jgi:hypothetical protein
MQFRVPQFIDVEDKLFGPLTFKQFVYLAGGAGLVFVIYKTIPLIFAIFLMIPVAGLAAALAFYKPNGKPFIFLFQSAIKYFTTNKLYVWKQKIKKVDKKDEETDNLLPPILPASSSSNLRDLSWSLDIEDNSLINNEEGE